MRENPSLKKFGYTGQEKVIRKRECGVRHVLSYFGTGEGEERRDKQQFCKNLQLCHWLHVVTLKRWPEKYHNIVNAVVE